MIFFFFIFLLEIFFGNWFKNNNYQNLLIPINKNRIITKLPYKSESPVFYSTDKNGFRANNYSLNDVKIMVIGGSTTEEKYIDDNLIWTKILDKNLRNFKFNKVINAGIGGQTSFGHIKMFDIWFSKHENLKPKFVLFYIGINDALYMVENRNNDYLNLGRKLNESNRDELVYDDKIKSQIQYIKNNSAIILFFKVIKGNYLSFKYKFNYGLTDIRFEKFSKSKDISNNITFNRNIGNINYLNNYRKNLSTLNELSINLGAVPIFITQSVDTNHWIYEFLNIINEETIKHCQITNTICFDLSNELKIKNFEYFDGIHTNPTASNKIGNYIFDKIINLNL